MNHVAIEKQYRQKLLDMSDLLASLDITVGFLVSVGGDPNDSLVQFMTDTLKMKTHRQLLTDAVSFHHVSSLIISLTDLFVIDYSVLLYLPIIWAFHS